MKELENLDEHGNKRMLDNEKNDQKKNLVIKRLYLLYLLFY